MAANREALAGFGGTFVRAAGRAACLAHVRYAVRPGSVAQDNWQNPHHGRIHEHYQWFPCVVNNTATVLATMEISPAIDQVSQYRTSNSTRSS